MAERDRAKLSQPDLVLRHLSAAQPKSNKDLFIIPDCNTHSMCALCAASNLSYLTVITTVYVLGLSQ